MRNLILGLTRAGGCCPVCNVTWHGEIWPLMFGELLCLRCREWAWRLILQEQR